MTLICADCSSLGLDKWTGHDVRTMPETGTCASCGGPWPLRAVKQPAAAERHQKAVGAMIDQIKRDSK